MAVRHQGSFVQDEYRNRSEEQWRQKTPASIGYRRPVPPLAAPEATSLHDRNSNVDQQPRNSCNHTPKQSTKRAAQTTVWTRCPEDQLAGFWEKLLIDEALISSNICQPAPITQIEERFGLAIKSTCCFCRGPRFNSQHPYSGSQPTVTPS